MLGSREHFLRLGDQRICRDRLDEKVHGALPQSPDLVGLLTLFVEIMTIGMLCVLGSRASVRVA